MKLVQLLCLLSIVCSMQAAEKAEEKLVNEKPMSPSSKTLTAKPGHKKGKSSVFVEHLVKKLHQKGHIGKPNPHRKVRGVAYNPKSGNEIIYDTPTAKKNGMQSFNFPFVDVEKPKAE